MQHTRGYFRHNTFQTALLLTTKLTTTNRTVQESTKKIYKHKLLTSWPDTKNAKKTKSQI